MTMIQPQGLTKGDAFQKISSASLIIGAILFGASGFLMPYAAKPTSNVQEMLTPLGENVFRTQVSSLVMVIGFWAALIGATGVYRSIAARPNFSAVWARLGLNFSLIGTALWTVSFSLDVATASAVARWLAAPAELKDAAWNVIAPMNAIGGALVPMTWTVYWLALAFLSIGMISSKVYSLGLGWAGLVLSIGVVTLGVVQIFTARSTVLTLIFAVLMLLTALWDLAVGIWVARRAW